MNQELSRLLDNIYDIIEHGNIHGAEWLLKSFQLDAFKAGAEWAADIANKTEHIMHDGGCLTTLDKCYYAIKQASSNLKEIPK